MNLRAFSIAAVLASLPMPSALADEWWVGAYGGYNTSFDSDVTVKRGGTAITYRDVSWDGASFEMPPYGAFAVTTGSMASMPTSA